MDQSEFSVHEAVGNSNASLQKRVRSLFLPSLPQFPLSSFARSSFAELVFVIRSPPRLTKTGQLAVQLFSSEVFLGAAVVVA